MARTIEFDRDEVLQNAVDIFWQDGYCMTSVSNLVAATHLNPGSIYSAFKSKEGLFMAALDYYGQRSIDKAQRYIDEATTPLVGVKTFLEKLADEMMSDKKQRGCFLVNTVLEMSSHNSKIQDQVNKQLNSIESLLLSALKSAQASGELSADKNPVVLAKYLLVNIWGLRVLAKTDASKNDIEANLEQLLLCLQD